MLDIGNYPAENSLCPVAVNTLLFIVTNGLNFLDIYFFLTVNIWQFNIFDFIIFVSCNMNIELNKQIFNQIFNGQTIQFTNDTFSNTP